jgi:hypothetical protein
VKGTIIACLDNLVTEKFGADKWSEILRLSNQKENRKFLATEDVDDAKTTEIIKNTTKVLRISLSQAADAFGEYWVNSYAPKIYKAYFRKYSNAKDFIKGMDSVHEITTQTVPNAHPPRFDYKDVDDKTMIVTYKSARNMIDFYIGLAKGVGIYFNTPIAIKKLSEKQVEIRFQ